jgi:hypothetical protein
MSSFASRLPVETSVMPGISFAQTKRVRLWPSFDFGT